MFFTFSSLLLQSLLTFTKSDVTTCPYNCYNYFDGCNYCSCSAETGAIVCTLYMCPIVAYKDPSCSQCPNNLVWGNCDACWRARTCDNPNGAEICTDNCAQECSCPDEFPIYDENTNSCLTLDMCDEYYNYNNTNNITNIINDTDSNIISTTEVPLVCPEYCLEYFDGCNTCTCDEETGLAACTKLGCNDDESQSVGKAVCLVCKNNLQWTSCGSQCWKEKTCDNPTGSEYCTLQCVEQCQCPDNKPIWNEKRQRCKKRRRCRN